MRLRNIKGSEKIVDEHFKTVNNYTEYKGRWKELFGNDKPIHIEIGIGLGGFIIQKAMKNKDVNYIGIERTTGALARVVKKIDECEEKLDNIYIVLANAIDLKSIFEDDEISKIYLNFSDPWPKARHEKRRLTHNNFLDMYSDILKSNAYLQFKTDNDGLFDFSIECMEKSKFSIVEKSTDLHNSNYLPENIMTEYEKKFSEKGKNINYVLIQNREK